MKPDELVQLVSHDLRNPLSAIMLSAAHLMRRPPTEENLRQRLETILAAAHRMQHLLDDLSDTAALQSGRSPLDRSAHPVAPLVDEALRTECELAAAKELRLEAPPPDPKLVVICDRERILRLLSLLVSNAIRLAPERGTVWLRTTVREDSVCFGIAPANLANRGLWRHRTEVLVNGHGGRSFTEGNDSFFFTLPLA